MALKENFLGGVKLILENQIYNFMLFPLLFYGYSKAYDDAAAR